MVIENYTDIKNAISELIDLRKRKYSTHITGPSKLWSEWLKILSFSRDFSDENLEKIRLHTGLGRILGTNWSTCYYEKNEIELGVKNHNESKYIQDYLRLTKNIPESFHCSEMDKNKEFISIKYNNKYINEDVLRFQSTMSNLSHLNPKNIETYLEIGAGYGGFCNQFFKHFQPKQTIVVDHPEILFWSATYTFLNSDIKIKILTEDDNVIDDSDFIFVPVFLIEKIRDLTFDLVVNENSFCEMTKRQVEYYLDNINFKLLYSNNRSRQFMNDELKDLNSIIKSNLESYPREEFYNNFYKDKLKRHNLKYIFFLSKTLNNLPNFDPYLLNGLDVKETF